MSLPPTVGEAEFVRVTAHIARVLFKKFGSVHGSEEDFAQQVVVWSLEAMPRYDPSRPLENYLYTNAKNRAMNAVRDRVGRTDYPCARCHAGTPCGEDGAQCPAYRKWAERNQAKAKLARPLGLGSVADEAERSLRAGSDVEADAVGRDLMELIDRELPISMRADYLRLLAGERVTGTERRRAVQRTIAEILARNGVAIDGDATLLDRLLRKPLRGQGKRRNPGAEK